MSAGYGCKLRRSLRLPHPAGPPENIEEMRGRPFLAELNQAIGGLDIVWIGSALDSFFIRETVPPRWTPT